MHVDHIGLGVEMIVPDPLQQHRAGHDLSGMAHQIFQQAELAGLEVDPLPGPLHLAGQQVHLEIADRELRLHRGRAAPAQQGLDPRQELGEGEGLGEIVVGAGAKPAHPVVDLAQRAQEQDGGDDLGDPQGLDHVQPVDLRQHAVDDDQVELPAGGMEKPVAPAGDTIHHITVLGQAFDHIGCGRLIVFDDQNAHGFRFGIFVAVSLRGLGV